MPVASLIETFPQSLIVCCQITWLLGAFICLFLKPTSERVPASILATGAIFGLAGAILSLPLHNHPTEFNLGISLGLCPLISRIDSLSAFFGLILALVVLLVAIYSPGYNAYLETRSKGAPYWFCLFIFVLSLSQIIFAANAVTLLIFWELSAFSSTALIALSHNTHKAQRAAAIYLIATKISALLLLCAFLIMHNISGSWTFADWHLANPAKSAELSLAATILLLLGLSVKAGLWPFHVWLPYAHTEAPSPLSALMSAAMVKVPVLLAIKLLLDIQPGITAPTLLDTTAKFRPLISAHFEAIGCILLSLGLISGIWGVLFAFMQKDLKRLLAYSTIENIGLLFATLGMAMIAGAQGNKVVFDLALTAICLHALTHAVFKSLMFLGAGAVDKACHSRDMSCLGGLAKRMPFTFVCFLTGGAAAASLPPLGGFASKWLIYTAALSLSYSHQSLLGRGLSLVTVGLLALIGALSLACFAKAIGISFLGKERSARISQAKEASPAMLAAQSMAACLCLFTGLLAPLILPEISPIICELAGSATNVGKLFSPPLTLICISGLLLFLCTRFLILKSGRKRPLLERSQPINQSVTWGCGFGPLGSRTEETSSSFAEPVARLFGSVVGYKLSAEISGRDRRHFPESIKVESTLIPQLEAKIFSPLLALLQTLSKSLLKLQTGSVHVHLLYVFLTLLLLVVVGMLS